MRGEGPARVRGGWGFNGSRPFESVFFSVFSGEFLEGRLELFFTFFVSFSGFRGCLFVSVFRKSIVFFEKVPTPDFCIQYSVLA